MAKRRTKKELSISAQDAFLKSYGEDIVVGDVFINDDGDYYRVVKFKYSDDTPVAVMTQLGTEKGDYYYRIEKEVDEISGKKYGKKWIKLDLSEPLEDLEKKAVLSLLETDEEVQESSSTELSVMADKDHLIRLKSIAQIKKDRAETFRRVIKSKMGRLNNIVDTMKKEISAIQRVIHSIELYLGVNEDVVQISDGAHAPEDTPITIRQLVLYMDEECGDPRERNGRLGIDFESVDDFDAWLLEGPKNLHRVFPESKGIVAIKPSRQKRTYSDNPWIQAQCDSENDMVYLLIRNGEKLYRVWTSISMDGRLYPGQEEMDKIFEEVERGGFYGDKAKDKEFKYKRQSLLLQGIIDRTELLKPMTHLVNLFKPDTYGGLVRFIRDAEPSLVDGHMPYKEWKDEINSRIKVGSRVFLSEIEWSEYNNSRFVRYYQKGTQPKLPHSGVYLVEDIAPANAFNYQKKSFVIYYNPGGEVYYGNMWEYDPHPRKNRLGFKVQSSESSVLNYDGIGLDDVEYFIDARLERQNYLNMIPVLWGIREQRIKEMEWESHFVELIAGRNGVPKDLVWEQVEWWKTKNKWKRPIDKDDSKALRMIEKRIKKEAE